MVISPSSVRLADLLADSSDTTEHGDVPDPDEIRISKANLDAALQKWAKASGYQLGAPAAAKAAPYRQVRVRNHEALRILMATKALRWQERDAPSREGASWQKLRAQKMARKRELLPKLAETFGIKTSDQKEFWETLAWSVLELFPAFEIRPEKRGKPRGSKVDAVADEVIAMPGKQAANVLEKAIAHRVHAATIKRRVSARKRASKR